MDVKKEQLKLTLLLRKVNGVLLGPETHAQTLVVVSAVGQLVSTRHGRGRSSARAGPSHELILPSTTSL